MIKNIVFAGGGLKGWAYIGTIKALHEFGITRVEQVIGVSVGALFGLLYILKFDSDFLLDYFIGLSIKDLIDIDIDNVLTNQSLLNGNTFTEIVREIISFKVDPDITFEQLRIHNGVLFTTNALNINDSKLEYFNYIISPKIKVVDAIRASCNLPFLFPGYIIQNKKYFDGGICNNCPDDLVDDLYSIAFDVSHPESSKSGNTLYSFFISLVNISNNLSKKKKSECVYKILHDRFKNETTNVYQTKDTFFNIYMNGYKNSKEVLLKNYFSLPVSSCS